MIRLSCWVGASYAQVPHDRAAVRLISLHNDFPLDVGGAEADRLGFSSAASALLRHFVEEKEASASREAKGPSELAAGLPARVHRFFEALDLRLGRAHAAGS